MPTVPLKQALERGIELQKTGQTEAAEKVFRQLISQHPTNPDVLNLLGETERAGRAGEVIRRFFAVADASTFSATGTDGNGLLSLQPELERVLEELEARL